MDLNFILQGLSPLLATLILIAIFAPVERLFPAISKRSAIKGRFMAIFIVGVVSALTMFGFLIYGQTDYINLLLSYQLVDVSKANVPDWVLFAGTFLFMDFVGYAIHYISHKFMPLWRIHSVHHSDEHVTAASSLLQHPLSALLNGCVHLFFAVLLGLPLLVFLIYGFATVLQSVFSHADIRLPQSVDRVLRWVIVTPDLHRTHHSIDMKEGNSNFGAIFTFWDRMFGTYIEHPNAGVPDLIMGLPSSESPKRFTAQALFAHPFRRRD